MTAITKRQLNKAAKIYALANTYHSLSGTQNLLPDEDKVTIEAIKWAEHELGKMGLHPQSLLSIQDCIDAVKD